MKTKKTFDAVKMSRQWKARVSQMMLKMTPEERVLHFSRQQRQQPPKIHAKVA